MGPARAVKGPTRTPSVRRSFAHRPGLAPPLCVPRAHLLKGVGERAVAQAVVGGDHGEQLLDGGFGLPEPLGGLRRFVAVQAEDGLLGSLLNVPAPLYHALPLLVIGFELLFQGIEIPGWGWGMAGPCGQAATCPRSGRSAANHASPTVRPAHFQQLTGGHACIAMPPVSPRVHQIRQRADPA